MIFLKIDHPRGHNKMFVLTKTANQEYKTHDNLKYLVPHNEIKSTPEDLKYDNPILNGTPGVGDFSNLSWDICNKYLIIIRLTFRGNISHVIFIMNELINFEKK